MFVLFVLEMVFEASVVVGMGLSEFVLFVYVWVIQMSFGGGPNGKVFDGLLLNVRLFVRSFSRWTSTWG